MANEKDIYNVLISVWMREYEALRGFKPLNFGMKEGNSLKMIIRKMVLLGTSKRYVVSATNCEALFLRFLQLAKEVDWYVHNWSLAILNSKFDDIVARSNKKTAKSEMQRYKEELKSEIQNGEGE